jgi:small subunit ribosomal protein S17
MPIKERSGVVISNKMEKTIVVSIENRVTHKKYGKVIAKTKKYKAHDEKKRVPDRRRCNDYRNETS